MAASNATTSSLRYQAVIQLLRTADTLWNTSRLYFARWNLSPSQFNVLNLLRGAPQGLSQTELSRGLITHRSNITGLVDRLEARRLLRRTDGPDRRAYRVVLTEEGLTLLNAILPGYHHSAECLWEDVPEERIEVLLSDLREAARNAGRIARDNPETLNSGSSYEPHPGEPRNQPVSKLPTAPPERARRRAT